MNSQPYLKPGSRMTEPLDHPRLHGRREDVKTYEAQEMLGRRSGSNRDVLDERKSRIEQERCRRSCLVSKSCTPGHAAETDLTCRVNKSSGFGRSRNHPVITNRCR